MTKTASACRAVAAGGSGDDSTIAIGFATTVGAACWFATTFSFLTASATGEAAAETGCDDVAPAVDECRNNVIFVVFSIFTTRGAPDAAAGDVAAATEEGVCGHPATAADAPTDAEEASMHPPRSGDVKSQSPSSVGITVDREK